MNPRVSKVTTMAGFCLSLVFTNGKNRTYNCPMLLEFGLFKELKKKYYFKQARVVDCTVVWSHEQVRLLKLTIQ